MHVDLQSNLARQFLIRFLLTSMTKYFLLKSFFKNFFMFNKNLLVKYYFTLTSIKV